jgi:hypothetical protein
MCGTIRGENFTSRKIIGISAIFQIQYDQHDCVAMAFKGRVLIEKSAKMKTLPKKKLHPSESLPREPLKSYLWQK